MNKSKFLFLFTVIFLLSISAVGQNNTNSPYTRFGYGELADPVLGKQNAMGGVSFGDRASSNINPGNPASYTSIDSLTFLFDMGASGKLSIFSQSDKKYETNFNGNLDYLAIEFPINKWLASSIGLIPYSFSGYSFAHSDSIIIPTSGGGNDEKAYYTQDYNGVGGINQVYAGVAGKFFNHVSIGVNATYLFGYLTNTRTLTFNGSSTVYGSATNLIVNDFNLRYGIQFFHTFNKNHTFTLGGVFENKSDLNGSYQTITTNNADSTIHHNAFESPLMYGGGINYSYKNKLSVGADFLQQQWAKAKYYGITDTLKNRTKISLGAQYQSNPNSKYFWERAIFRAGANYANSYIISNPDAYDFSFSLGLGIPLKGSNSIINFALLYGKQGTSNLIREDYLKFSINATFNELWFFKRRFE